MDTDNDGIITLQDIENNKEGLNDFDLGQKWENILRKCDLRGNG